MGRHFRAKLSVRNQYKRRWRISMFLYTAVVTRLGAVYQIALKRQLNALCPNQRKSSNRKLHFMIESIYLNFCPNAINLSARIYPCEKYLGDELIGREYIEIDYL